MVVATRHLDSLVDQRLCLSAISSCLADARRKAAPRRYGYNTIPHGSLGNKTPLEAGRPFGGQKQSPCGCEGSVGRSPKKSGMRL